MTLAFRLSFSGHCLLALIVLYVSAIAFSHHLKMVFAFKVNSFLMPLIKFILDQLSVNIWKLGYFQVTDALQSDLGVKYLAACTHKFLDVVR